GRGFDHLRAADGQRRRELARDHRQWEVPRCDRGGDADGGMRDEDALLGTRRRDRVAVHTLTLRGRPLDEPHAVGDLRARLWQRLAGLRRNQVRELVARVTDRIVEAKQDSRALRRGPRRPRDHRGGGGIERGTELPRSAARDLRKELVGAGVTYRK